MPAFLALVAEPLFLLADAAIVGRLGVAPLAGLGVASAVLLTSANIFVFLAYGTTAVVARQLGAGSRAGAIAAGIDGTWLAIGLGDGHRRRSWPSAPARSRTSSAPPTAAIGAGGDLPADLGARHPRHARRAGHHRGAARPAGHPHPARSPPSAGSASTSRSTSGSCTGCTGASPAPPGAPSSPRPLMAGALVLVLVRYAARTTVPLRAHPGRVLAAARVGVPLLVRTLALRAVLLVTTWVAAGLGDVPLAAYQVTATIWTFLAFALDALAIAAQAITGKALGAGEVDRTRDATTLVVRWGVVVGVVLGLLVLLLRPCSARSSPPTPPCRRRSPAAWSSWPWASRSPASSSSSTACSSAPATARGWPGPCSRRSRPTCPSSSRVNAAGDWLLEGGSTRGQVDAVIWLWIAFTAFMSVRGTLMWMRVRTDRWMVTGATRSADRALAHCGSRADVAAAGQPSDVDDGDGGLATWVAGRLEQRRPRGGRPPPPRRRTSAGCRGRAPVSPACTHRVGDRGIGLVLDDRRRRRRRSARAAAGPRWRAGGRRRAGSPARAPASARS